MRKARSKLREGKLYLKTKYRDQCKETDSCCPDHCRAFALSDAAYQEPCNHAMTFSDCESLESVLHDVEATISKFVTQLGKVQADHLKFAANNAACKVLAESAYSPSSEPG